MIANAARAHDQYVRRRYAPDVKVAGRWGIVSGHETNSVLNQPETGHGLPKKENGVAVRNNGQPLGYLPVMTDATRATTFDDIGCVSCHHNGNKITNGQVDDTFQDFNIHEPGVVAEATVSNDGIFTRLNNQYIFEKFAPPADSGGRQNISSRNTKHLRAFWDSVPRWLNHGAAHTIREILLGPDSPLLAPGERGFNFRTVRTDHSRRVAHDYLGGPPIVLPTEVPITVADSGGQFAGDGKGPIYVSLDRPVQVSPPDAAYPEGRLLIDRLGSDNLAPLIVVNGGVRQITPAPGGQQYRRHQRHARADVAAHRGGCRRGVVVLELAAEVATITSNFQGRFIQSPWRLGL